ncbi:MAG: glycosyltransferase [Candidatus Nanohaloarchaea archaeon]|nr:glycosyltransferase [Candidatus Nanohaloarchaea archaeon]
MTEHVAFLATELFEPAGGLYRYTTNLLQAWDKKLENDETDLEPLIISVKNPNKPMKDLSHSERFSELTDRHEHLSVYEAERGGRTVYFVEGEVPDLDRFHYELWDRYRIPSDVSSHWDGYNSTLSPFWYWAPKLIEFLMEEEGLKFKAADAQDWLAFPAGFLTMDDRDIPLNCRIHSGEYGRSLGNINNRGAPVWIEAGSLAFSDYIQGVSINETRFELRNLMSFKKSLVRKLREDRGEDWSQYQEYRDRKLQEFLIFEKTEELVMLRDLVGGMPNGIFLDDWDDLEAEDIEEGRSMLERFLPGKEQFIFFIGRPVYRKGIDFLIDAFAETVDKHPEAGLVLASSMSEEDKEGYEDKLEELGIREDVHLLTRWLEDREKKSIFTASDIIALPSVYEPFGIVALEALAADYAAEENGYTGPAVVVGDTGGMDEITQSGESGMEVPTQDFEIDPDLLDQVFCSLMPGNIKEEVEHDSQTLRERISSNGAERVQDEKFRWDYILDRVFEVYDRAEENHEEKKQLLEGGPD